VVCDLVVNIVVNIVIVIITNYEDLVMIADQSIVATITGMNVSADITIVIPCPNSLSNCVYQSHTSSMPLVIVSVFIIVVKKEARRLSPTPFIVYVLFHAPD
jgi:hypothetical protein